MHLFIITPESTLFSGEASMVTAPGTLGEFGVLPGHAPFISSLRPGVIVVERSGEAPVHIAVIDGIAEVTPEHCTILAQQAKLVSGINPADARAERRAAEEAMEAALNEQDTAKAEKRLALARVVDACVH